MSDIVPTSGVTFTKGLKPFIKPDQIIKAAEVLKPFFTNSKGEFNTDAFAQRIGLVLKNEGAKKGFWPHVTIDSKGKFQLDYKKDRSVKDARRDAESIPVQIEKMLLNWPKIGGPDLLKRYKKYVTSNVGQQFKQASAASTDEAEVQGGHILPLIGKEYGSQTPQAPPNVGKNPLGFGPGVIDEFRFPRVEFDEDGKFIYTPGNIKGNNPLGHFDPKDLEIAGGGTRSTWLEDITQFMVNEIYGGEEGITGTNVENLTETDLAYARDRNIPVQVMAAKKDIQNQIIRQTQNLIPAPLSKPFGKGIDPQTGLPIKQKPEILDIFKRPDNMFKSGSTSDLKTRTDTITAQKEALGLNKITLPSNAEKKRMNKLGYKYFDENTGEWLRTRPGKKTLPPGTEINTALQVTSAGAEWGLKNLTGPTGEFIKGIEHGSKAIDALGKGNTTSAAWHILSATSQSTEPIFTEDSRSSIELLKLNPAQLKLP